MEAKVLDNILNIDIALLSTINIHNWITAYF
jgi:hypothetical protein